MKAERYIQIFEQAGQSSTETIPRLIQPLRAIYGDGHHILTAQIPRYLEALRRYAAVYGDAQKVILVRAPGRVDLIGSHTDYHQGYVLPMALDKHTILVAGKRSDTRIVLHNTDAQFPPTDFWLEPQIPLSPKGHWENYVKAAAQAFVKAYGIESLSGMNVVVEGRPPYGTPVAAGLSSSSALLIAAAIALAELNAISMAPKTLARFCGEAEWYVGTRGGFMDHFTSILNQQGHALFLDCRPVQISGLETFRTEHIPIPPGYAVAVCNTNVKKQKSASSEYNTRALECRIGVELLKPHVPGVRYLRDVPAETPLHQFLPVATTYDKLTHLLDPNLVDSLFQDYTVVVSQPLKILPRCRHVIAENARVLHACELLKAAEMDAFGAVMTDSYHSISDDFEASCPELDTMIASALECAGTLGARIAGAGWGGCAVVLVEDAEAAHFQAHLAETYSRQTGLQADIFLCQPGQGAGVVSLEGEDKDHETS
ncbi:galactokinase [candidate division KSB3 bacterium]|uniref:Galactokinase n=1 Tax=candidate division KSB3 bacterium TaxID=2044937 RepID=A0A9D5JY40_9BACT|nr:galactokinase [candidate division KSB3 bacterium]MBD3325957.1 galactokinase [candidate division KSB3 bacterium]